MYAIGCGSGVRAKFAAVNRHSVEDIVALYAADAELTAPDFCSPRHGHDDVRRTYQALFSAYPDISVHRSKQAAWPELRRADHELFHCPPRRDRV
jgi:hypothetical protein